MSEKNKTIILAITVAIAIIAGLTQHEDVVPVHRFRPEFRHNVPLRDQVTPTPTPQLIVEIRGLRER
jgi:hypothetical protein